MVEPETASFAEFARRLGCKRGYVTELRKADRLVLTEDGRRVRVAESLARIEATRDPAKRGVAARHAAARAKGQGGAHVATQTPTQPFPSEGTGSDRISSTYQASRAVRERYLAMQAKLDYEKAAGGLLDAAEVSAALFAATTTLRVRLESLPGVVAPRIAMESEEARITAILSEEIEHMLAECERQFLETSKPPAPETR